MTQHYYPTEHQGKAVTVLMGWDRRLQGYFMVIEDDDATDDSYVYSNLDDAELAAYAGLPPTLDPFIAKLAELGLTVPSHILEAVRCDGAENAGNRWVIYDRDGSVKPE